MDKKIRKVDYFVVTLITLVFILIIAANTSLITDMVNNQAEEVGRVQLESIKTEMQETLSEAENSLMKITVGVEQLMREKAGKEAVEEFITSQKKEQYSLTNGRIFNVYTAGKGWEIIPDFDKPESYHGSDRLWYKGAEASEGEIYITEPYVDSMSGDVCFTMSLMLSDKDTVVSMDFNLSGIQESVRKMIVGDDRTALIVTENGTILGYSDMSLAGEKVATKLGDYYDIYYDVVIRGVAKSFTYKLNNKTNTVFSSSTNNGWYLILCVDNDALYGAGYKQVAMNIAINLVMLVIIIVFYLRSAKNRSKAENALRTREAFLSKLSGDFRKPVRNILKLSDTARIENSVDVNESLQDIKESGLQLSEMIDNLFSYSTIQNDINAGRRAKKSRKDISRTIRRTRRILVGIFAVLLLIVSFVGLEIGRALTLLTTNDVLNNYESIIESWTTQQKTIISMYVNSIKAQPEILDSYEGAVSWLNNIAENYSQISMCYIANPYTEHTVIMNNGWEPDSDWKVEERQWYIDTEKSETGFSISKPYYDEQTGSYCLTMSKIVYGQNDEFLGIFGIDFYVDKIIDVLGEIKLSDSYAFLVDGDGYILNHPYDKYQMSSSSQVNIRETEYAVVSKELDSFTLNDYNGVRSVVMCQGIANLGFKLYVVCQWWEISGGVFIVCLVIIFILTILLAIVLYLINKIIHWQNDVNLQLTEAAAQATAAGRAKSQFLAQMSHEIRTPINAVIGMDEMILRESNDPEILDYAENIQSAGKTLLNLINGILDFSKIEDGKMEIVQVRYRITDILDDIVTMISEKAVKKGLDFRTEIDPALPRSLYGDDVRIKQIIINLLTNAVKYTPKGYVALIVKGEVNDDVCMLKVSVKDSGIGIKPEDKEKLFTSFIRLDEEKNRNIEGTGLGISIVSGLLSMMGSGLTVNSVYGEGSEFSFELRQQIIDKTEIGEYDSGRRRERKNDSKKECFVFEGVSVLVVDDNEMNLKVAKGLMKRYNIVPDLCDSGHSCLEILKDKKYDLIFLDHMMPGMDGVETLQRIKSEKLVSDDVPVIVLTANALAGVRDQYIKEGFTDYLAKPIEVDKLEEMLVTYLPKDRIVNKDNNISDENSKPGKVLNKGSETVPGGNNAGNAGTVDDATGGRLSYLQANGVNTDAGIEYSAGSEDFYYEMLAAFVEEYDVKSAEIAKNFEERNLTDYRTRVHALKGTSRMLGINKLADKAFMHENAAKEGRTEDIEKDYEALMKLYQDYVQIIKEALEK